MRPGAQFTAERLANTLREQASLGEMVRRVAGTGDLVPWADPMRGSVSDPAAFANLAGHYVRFNDLVYVTFKVAFSGAGVGSGNFLIPLPVDSWSSSSGIRGRWRASQGGSEIDGNVVIDGVGNVVMTYRTSAAASAPLTMTHAQPFAWAAGASIDGWIEYLAAKGS